MPFMEQALAIAKKWCTENDYELERSILWIPQVRRLIKKKWGKGFFDGNGQDYSEDQKYFDSIEYPENINI
jgi:hypothetical protein